MAVRQKFGKHSASKRAQRIALLSLCQHTYTVGQQSSHTHINKLQDKKTNYLCILCRPLIYMLKVV